MPDLGLSGGRAETTRSEGFRHQGVREQAIRERELRAREHEADPVTITMARAEWWGVLTYKNDPLAKIEEALDMDGHDINVDQALGRIGEQLSDLLNSVKGMRDEDDVHDLLRRVDAFKLRVEERR